MVVIMATTTAALLLAAIGIVTFDTFFFRRSLKRDLSALARIIADNSTAALAFNDPRAASETLAALRARPHLVTRLHLSIGRIGTRQVRATGRHLPNARLRAGRKVTDSAAQT